MTKFRKPQVVVELEQFQPGSDQPGVCLGFRYAGCTVPKNTDTQLAPPHLHTMHEGQTVLLENGDWIAPEPDGIHFYPIKPEVVNGWERIDD